MALKEEIQELEALIKGEDDATMKEMYQEMLDEKKAELGTTPTKSEDKPKKEKKTTAKKDGKMRFVFEKKVEGGKEVDVIEAMTQETAESVAEEGFEFVKVITRGRAPKKGFVADAKPKGKRGRPAKTTTKATKTKTETADEMAKRLGLSKAECEKLLEKYDRESQKRKSRVAGRKKAGKSAELSVDESLENEAEIIENKVDKKAPTKRQVQKSTKSITKVVQELIGKMNADIEAKVAEIDNLIEELYKLRSELEASKKARGGMFGKGGKTDSDKEDDLIPVVRYFFEDEPFEYGRGGNS